MKKAYFERKHMKRKEVEDVMGGAQAWENVDKTEGMGLVLLKWWEELFDADERQCNVRMRSAIIARRSSSSCRSEVRMSR